jgi:hypothetical protein
MILLKSTIRNGDIIKETQKYKQESNKKLSTYMSIRWKSSKTFPKIPFYSLEINICSIHSLRFNKEGLRL